MLEFLKLPTESFTPPELPTSPNVNAAAYSDATMYYMATNELTLKLTLLLDFIGYEDPKACEFANLDHALSQTARIIMQGQLEPAQLHSLVVDAFISCVSTYKTICQLLCAPRIAPDPAHLSIRRSLQFMMVGADTLFHLTRTGSADAYINGGYIGTQREPVVNEAYSLMLERYTSIVDNALSAGC